MSRNATLVYIIKGDKILLGTKKYGGAKGILNGFGGKIEEFDKDILEAAKREVVEETSLDLKTVFPIGVLKFHWEYKDDSASFTCLKLRISMEDLKKVMK